jgi:hypothetical protein
MKATDNTKDIGRRACKPDSVQQVRSPRQTSERKRHAAVIIPLGHDSRRDSSSLPEGFICRGLRRRKGERIHFRKR